MLASRRMMAHPLNFLRAVKLQADGITSVRPSRPHVVLTDSRCLRGNVGPRSGGKLFSIHGRMLAKLVLGFERKKTPTAFRFALKLVFGSLDDRSNLDWNDKSHTRSSQRTRAGKRWKSFYSFSKVPIMRALSPSL